MSRKNNLWSAVERTIADHKLSTDSSCVSWILITEHIDSKGKIWLQEATSSELPSWRRMGILYYLMNEIGDEPEDD